MPAPPDHRCVVSAGDKDPPEQMAGLSARFDATLPMESGDVRRWFLAVLEEHRNLSFRDIKNQFEVLQSFLSEQSGPITFPVYTSGGLRNGELEHEDDVGPDLGAPTKEPSKLAATASQVMRNAAVEAADKPESKLSPQLPAIADPDSDGTVDDDILDRENIGDSSDQSRQKKDLELARPRPTISKVMKRFRGQNTSEDLDEAQLLARTCCPCIFGRVPKEDDGSGRAEGAKIAEESQSAANNLFGEAGDATSKMDLWVGFLILANSVVMMMNLEYGGHETRVSLGMAPNDGRNAAAHDVFGVLEHVFNALFVLELFLRIGIVGLALFKDIAALFDMTLVVMSSLQVYVLDPLDITAGTNFTLFRMLRFIRFVRVLRIVRVLRLFSELRVLVKTCLSSFKALVWSMVLLALIMVMAGMFLTELLKEFIRDEEKDMIWRTWAYRHYGTSSRAMYTMFEVTLAGCWPNYFRPLIEHVSGWYVLFSILYIALVVFAIIRIITAIFLKETLQIAGNDAEMMVNEQMKKKSGYIRKLENVFKAVDISGDGKLSVDEFESICMHHKVRTWLAVLELEVHDARALFHLLDDGDGEVTYEEFLKGVMRLKGQARSIDVVGIMRSTDKCLEAVKDVKVQMAEVYQRVTGKEPMPAKRVSRRSIRE